MLLRWHAGLEGNSLDPASVAGATANEGDASRAVESFIEALDRFNRDQNGATPSASTTGLDTVPVSAAYSVSEVTRMLRASGLDDLAWDVDAAWNAVLAGDIDDIVEQVALERAARRRA